MTAAACRRPAAHVLGAALVLALTATTASAAPHHAPRVQRVSTAADGTQADGASDDSAISADRRHVTFVSTAQNLGCADLHPCLLVKDLAGGGLTRIDLGPGYLYSAPMPSADGSRVGYSAGTRFLVPYLYDRDTGRSVRLWPQSPPGFNEMGRVQSISPDGRHVAYTIGNRHGPQAFRLLYVRDTATGTDELVSPPEEGAKPAASVSGDGERVAYQLQGSEQDPADIFVKDLVTGERVQADTGLGAAELVRITGNGRRVLFNAGNGVYVHDLRTGVSRRVAEGRAYAATADGRYALVAGADGLRVHDLLTGRLGAVLPTDATVGPDSLATGRPDVVFGSAESDLVPGDTNGVSDVFVLSGALSHT